MIFFKNKFICGIDLDCDKIFITLVDFTKNTLRLVKEIRVTPLSKNDCFLPYFKENAELIDQVLRDAQQEFQSKIAKIFLVLPKDIAGTRLAAETHSFKQNKRISKRDIDTIKKSVEANFLDWDEICVHHLVNQYQIDDKSIINGPIGAQAGKISIDSQMIWVKNKLYKDTRDVFRNINRNFGGFIQAQTAALSSRIVDSDYMKSRVCLHIGYNYSFWVFYGNNRIKFGKEIDFGLRSIVEKLSARFGFSFELGLEIIERYITFLDVSTSKEITVKTTREYFNLSLCVLINSLKELIGAGIKGLYDDFAVICAGAPQEIIITGRFNDVIGFQEFTEQFLPCVSRASVSMNFVSLGFGAVNYGVSRWLETNCSKKESLACMAARVYGEYF